MTVKGVLHRTLTEQGANLRFIVTSFEEADAKYLYETGSCGRGKMELMIKDHKGALQFDTIRLRLLKIGSRIEVE